jgi:hypothetical protein
MAVSKKPIEQGSELEIRKVKALEKISNSLEDISMWLEDIDKDEWSNRIQHYLSEFLEIAEIASGKKKDNINE